ncbi:uncharacterized protein LOC131664667 [Phymastichus coffea]|uniref:uncharacterized protein LOC131664667 n=1 Tax=Phymastichus coffea TaxID=108790 RepID=UPI00273CDA66|nr:uncharacterized protein LOC131664667 [Phymastichus coffea]
MASLLERAYLVILLGFLLSVVVGELEKPDAEAAINNTVSFVFGVSQQRDNTSDDYATSTREPKALKMNPYQSLNITTSTDHPVSSAVQLTSANKSDNRLLAKTTSSPQVTAKNRRSTPHRKYSNHHYSTGQSEREDKRKIYVTSEDYSEQQYQNYQQDNYVPQPPEYEDPYSTIPVEQNLAGYEAYIPESYREPYPVTDLGYYGPPIPPHPVYEESPPDDPERECHCPENRQLNCDNTAADFIALVGALGANLWALIQLIATSSLPFIIPLLVIKLILVPIGIIKFLALIKIFFKLFIILPFFVRHIYPALTQSFNLHDLIFQKIQDAASHIHNHDIQHPHDEDIESRTNFNASSVLNHQAYNNVNDTKIWDLRGCPTRVACELGAFLSTSTYVNFPQKLANYLSKRAEQVKAKSKSDGSTDDNEVDYEDEDEEEDQKQRQDQAFKAFIIALGKKWTQEQCQIYSCSILF